MFYVAKALARTLRRVALLHVDPLKAIDLILREPDIGGLFVMILVYALLNYYAWVLALHQNVFIHYVDYRVTSSGSVVVNETLIAYLETQTFDQMLSSLFMHSLLAIALWFTAYVLLWLAATMAGGSMKGAAALSVAGYLVILKTPLLLLYAAFFSMLAGGPAVIVEYTPGKPSLAPLIAAQDVRYRIVESQIGLPLNVVIAAVANFYTFLSLLMTIYILIQTGVRKKVAIPLGLGVYLFLHVVVWAFQYMNIFVVI